MNLSEALKKKNMTQYRLSVQSGVSHALVRMLSRIDLDRIECFIDSEQYLSPLQNTFYKYYIKQRYDKILMAACKKINA